MNLAAAFQAAPVYAIYDTQLRRDLAAADVVRAWMEAGIRVIQYRHKGPLDGRAIEECRQLAQLVTKNKGSFVVNDRADLALLVQADGVHLGQDDLPPTQARRLLLPSAIVGYSTHNQDQITAALSMPIDYLAAGPVFQTSTKLNPDQVVGLELLRYARQVSRLPVVAIGGIDLDNMRSVLRTGADAVAMISGLLNSCRTLHDVQARARHALQLAISVGRQSPAAP